MKTLPCPECNATGYANDDHTIFCTFCMGGGVIDVPEPSDAFVPPPSTNFIPLPGVDDAWIQDVRVAMGAILGSKNLARDEELGRPALKAEEIVKFTVEIADGLAEERKKRGGVRQPPGVRDQLADFQEALPAMLAAFEQVMKAIKSHDRSPSRDPREDD